MDPGLRVPIREKLHSQGFQNLLSGLMKLEKIASLTFHPLLKSSIYVSMSDCTQSHWLDLERRYSSPCAGLFPTINSAFITSQPNALNTHLDYPKLDRFLLNSHALLKRSLGSRRLGPQSSLA